MFIDCKNYLKLPARQLFCDTLGWIQDYLGWVNICCQVRLGLLDLG